MFKNTEEFIKEYRGEFLRSVGEAFETCDDWQKYAALSKLICNKAAHESVMTQQRQLNSNAKRVYYFSMEFLIGRLLKSYLINLGIEDLVREGLAQMGEDLDYLCDQCVAPGLGNGGLGRLAACFMDSLASLGYAGYGMGLRYDYGLFRQKIVNGRQVELPDAWLYKPYPWELHNEDDMVEVRLGGVIERHYQDGKLSFTHHGYKAVAAVPYDIPIVGWGGKTVNKLRLWHAKPLVENFDLEAFNRGDYSAAMRDRNEISALTAVLYPEDSTEAGKALRLNQEYFLSAAGIGSIIRRYRERYGDNAWQDLPKRVAIHINDTHPALCVPELMRVLMDDMGLGWDEAWEITTHTISYTNHTVLPEALETWSIDLMRRLLPRIYMIVEEIDRRFRESLQWPGWQDHLRSTAILWDDRVRMANLAVIGSYSVNGVAALHTEILKNDVMKDFYKLYPERFNNKTNGVTHRRFLMEANPRLTRLIDEAIGDEWRVNPSLLQNLLRYEDDDAFLEQLAAVKLANKQHLADFIKQENGIVVDPESVFDVHVKRIHAYKRQLLNVFKIMDLYNQLHDNPNMEMVPHTFIFSGKAAAGYAFAKEVIRLICSVAELVNKDPVCQGKIKVVFVENFTVYKAQKIYPAADISEQISTAGKEASGTGNMKFMFNGAITLGTLDGANIEILEQVGRDNICIFGLTAEQVMNYYLDGSYLAFTQCKNDLRLQRITEQLTNGHFAGVGGDFWGIYDPLLRNNDEYFVLKDFDSYINAWNSLGELYQNEKAWRQVSLRNIAKAGYFSSDRTIKEYVKDIWHL